MPPDRLLSSDEFGVWYAFYDQELAVLSNSTGELETYFYSNKTEYRDVRRYIVLEYGVTETKIYEYNED